MTPKQIAKKIIEENLYLTLATSDGTDTWAAPLFYAVDEDFNFYFVSDKESLHCKHIKDNSNVAAAIFNSQEDPGEVNGVQFEGKAAQVSLKELPKAIKTLFDKRFPDIAERIKHDLSKKRFKGVSKYRLCKIVPRHFYILDPKNKKEDIRIEVKLK